MTDFCHLRLRTEYSFRYAFGRVRRVIETAGGRAVGIADSGTWGHVDFWNAARDAGVRPILGAEIQVVPNPKARDRQGGPRMAFLARDHAGLRELYELVTKASREENFYYIPRASYDDVNLLSSRVLVLSGANADLDRLTPKNTVWLEMNPENPAWNRKVKAADGWQKVVCGSNYYPTSEDREAYEVLAGRNARERLGVQHIPNRWELELAVPEASDAEFAETARIADLVTMEDLPKARMVSYTPDKTLRERCVEGARVRGLTMTDEYRARLIRELRLIQEKEFEDYFYVIADMIAEAKAEMLVGPGRGSAAGSLVCYLLGITEVDPIEHDLLFERFIDVTRSDLPDIDIDFPDQKRERVIEQLAERYGEDRVGRIGTVSRYRPRSALVDVARELDVPPWETEDFKESVDQRAAGDERSDEAVRDALETTEAGRELLEKHPGMRIAADLEGHARHSGRHAGGVLVTERALTHYCATGRDGSAQLDKRDAEALNMLKIDCLGLRTLSVIEDTLQQIGRSREWLVDYPLDDEAALDVIRNEKYSGIFQFEGGALQRVSQMIPPREFDDLVALTSLARPGPLHAGADEAFRRRRMGEEVAEPLHPLIEGVTADTEHLPLYQEQVMAICRVMGQMSWEDVTAVRRGMSKSMGDEYLNQYFAKFREGALAQGATHVEAERVWRHLQTWGSYGFNRSHAVSYSLISYWCAALKAHHPLEFGAACLRNAKSDDQSVQILRELVREGYEYTPVDLKHSRETWTVADGKLIGGLQNVKGIGPAKSREIIERREAGKSLTPGIVKLMTNPETPFDHLFEAEEKFGHIYREPEAHGIVSGRVWTVDEVRDPGEYVVIARATSRVVKDLNEYSRVQKRGGKKITRNHLKLSLRLEDDTGSMPAHIGRYDFAKWGKPLLEDDEDQWYLWKGIVKEGFNVIMVEKWRRLDGTAE